MSDDPILEPVASVDYYAGVGAAGGEDEEREEETTDELPSPLQQQDATFDSAQHALAVYDDIQNSNEEFEETIRHYARLRREQQNTTLGELQVKVSRLQAALSAETKRRVAAVTKLQADMKSEVEAVEKRLSEQLRDQQAQTDERLDILEERLARLETRWETDVNAVHGDVTGRSEALGASVSELEAKLDEERTLQQKRQEEFNQQVDGLSDRYDEKWTEERQDRLSQLLSLNERLDRQDVVREEQLRKFEQSVRVELQLLQQELSSETQERQVQDAEIVAGLNRYIQQVQKSLSYVSGV